MEYVDKGIYFSFIVDITVNFLILKQTDRMLKFLNNRFYNQPHKLPSFFEWRSIKGEKKKQTELFLVQHYLLLAHSI